MNPSTQFGRSRYPGQSRSDQSIFLSPTPPARSSNRKLIMVITILLAITLSGLIFVYVWYLPQQTTHKKSQLRSLISDNSELISELEKQLAIASQGDMEASVFFSEDSLKIFENGIKALESVEKETKTISFQSGTAIEQSRKELIKSINHKLPLYQNFLKNYKTIQSGFTSRNLEALEQLLSEYSYPYDTEVSIIIDWIKADFSLAQKSQDQLCSTEKPKNLNLCKNIQDQRQSLLSQKIEPKVPQRITLISIKPFNFESNDFLIQHFSSLSDILSGGQR